jgi:acyl-CoA thioesterase-1
MSIAAVCLSLFTLSTPVLGQDAKPAAKKPAAKKQAAKKPVNSAMIPPQVQPGLPNVLLIGDSISIGYTVMVRDALAGEANVFRPLTNCGPTTNGVESVEAWIGDRKWDVIHFNFGLHDLKYMGSGGKNLADPKAADSHQQVPIDQYAANLRKIASRLKETGATVIWRETTPVPEGAAGRVVGDAKKYNEAAAKVMKEIGGIETDAMFQYALDHAEQLPANVHYTKEGSQALADHVVKSIRKAMKAK